MPFLTHGPFVQPFGAPTWPVHVGEVLAEIDVLAYSSLFLAEDVELLHVLVARARAGVRLHVLLGDPESPAVVGRGDEEGIAEAMPAKVRNAVVHYRSLAGVDGVEIRLHSTVLYNSLYRADEDLLVNTHIHGVLGVLVCARHDAVGTSAGMSAIDRSVGRQDSGSRTTRSHVWDRSMR